MTVVKTKPFTPPFKQQPKPDPVTISFVIDRRFGPALRAAISDISNQVGHKLEQPYAFVTEDALTEAAVALGSLRAAVNAVVPVESKHYV